MPMRNVVVNGLFMTQDISVDGKGCCELSRTIRYCRFVFSFLLPKFVCFTFLFDSFIMLLRKLTNLYDNSTYSFYVFGLKVNCKVDMG